MAEGQLEQEGKAVVASLGHWFQPSTIQRHPDRSVPMRNDDVRDRLLRRRRPLGGRGESSVHSCGTLLFYFETTPGWMIK